MKRFFILFFVLCCLFTSTANGQYTVLFNFNSTNAEPYGYYPGGSLTLSGSTLYGMIQIGTPSGHGGAFKIDTNGGGYTELFGFSGGNGAYPVGSLLLSGGSLYGMTDGARFGSSWGNIFSIDTSGNGFNNLLNFNKTNGETPQGSLIISGSKMFGMAMGGGAYNNGCVFSIDTDGSSFKELLYFNDTDGSSPKGDLTLSGGKLYGMTYFGGTYNKGVIFAMDTNGSNYKKILDFNDTNGANPGGNLTISGSKFYGMTALGGTHNNGCIFSIDTTGGGYKDILDFNGANGLSPWGSLTLINGRLYGLSWHGGANGFGCMFRIDTNGNNYRDLLDFNDTNGAYPESNDLIISGNVLYGMTSQGGTYGFGVIFSFKDTTTNIATSVINLNSNTNFISLYPNPTSNKIFVTLTPNSKESFCQVYTITGQQVWASTIAANTSTFEIPVGDLNNGIYFLKLQTPDGSTLVKKVEVIK